MKQQRLWIEVWIDSAAQGDYILVLRGYSDGSIEVVDPQQRNVVVATFALYEDALHWLNEDEYDRVEGRWHIDV